MMGRHYDFQRLITAAYDDFLVAVREQPEQRLQAEIEKQFGMVARPRVIQTNALLLTLKNPDLLKSLAAQEPMTMDQFNQTVPFASLVKQWEIDLEIPIADQTGLTNRYDLRSVWPPNGIIPVEDGEAIKQELLNKLGLELVPSQQPIEMLVVEKG